jgi:hypothetical protein
MEGRFEDVPPGEDQELNDAIRIMLATSGFELRDPESIRLVELALRKKLEMIAANAHFYAGIQDGERSKALQLSQLKPALNEANIRIDRPDFIVEQPQSKIATRRRSNK